MLWTFLFTLTYGISANAEGNTFKTPDFAFPQTVSDNAEKAINAGVKSHDEVMVLRGMMQACVAKDLISRENAGEGIKMFETYSKDMSAPYSSLASLLEATLYTEIYNDSRWTYDQRSMSAAGASSDYRTWNRDQFSRKVCGLVSQALSGMPEAGNMPLGRIADIVLTDTASMPALTVADFMAIQSVKILKTFSGTTDARVIPFFDTFDKGNRATELSARNLISQILDRYSVGDSDDDAWHNAYMAYALHQLAGINNETFLRSMLQRYADTPECAIFLTDLYSSGIDSDTYKADYAEIVNYLRKFPNCRYHAELENLKKRFEREMINYASPTSVFIPQDSIRGNLDVTNMFDFYLLAVKLPDSYVGKQIKLSNLGSVGKVVSSVRITEPGSVPARYSKEIAMTPVSPGAYAIVASSSPDIKGVIIPSANKDAQVSAVLVSEITTLKKADPVSGRRMLYVVRGADQCPISGAKVEFTPTYRQGSAKAQTLVTGTDGSVVAPDGYYKVKANYKGNITTTEVWSSHADSDLVKSVRARILPDLSVYHPGDSIGFVAMLYNEDCKVLSPAVAQRVSIILNDANWQGIDTLQLITDADGRVSGKLSIPESGLLGTWNILARIRNNTVGDAQIAVSEYKAPTFYVSVSNAGDNSATEDIIHINGMVATYSGMPVGNAKIAYEVRYQSYPWMAESNNASYGGETMSDASGKFIIELHTANLKGTPYARGRYTLSIDATSPAGETQSAPSVAFSLGAAYSISADLSDRIDASANSLSCNVSVFDQTGRPVKKEVEYTIINSADTMLRYSGIFISPCFEMPLKKLPSGAYDVEFKLKEDTAANAVAPRYHVLIWRKSDLTPPTRSVLWIPQPKIIVPSGDKTVKVQFGSSYPGSYIFIEQRNSDGSIKREWLRLDSEMASIEVGAPGANQRVWLTIGAMHHLVSSSAVVEIIPQAQTERVKIESESFRDRITPGSSEKWKFRVSFEGKSLADIPISAVMTNKALNNIAPFRWSFNPYGSINWDSYSPLEYAYPRYYGWTMIPSGRIGATRYDLLTPEWELYGYGLYGRHRYSELRMKKSRSVAATGQTSVAEYAGDSVEEAYVSVQTTSANLAMAEGAISMDKSEAADDAGENGSAVSDSDPLRNVEIPSAFFMPLLHTDEEGMVNLEFTAPDFVGTWQFQLAGYTRDMRGAVFCTDVVSSKPVMVSMNAPRYMMTGDLCSIALAAYNNTEESAEIGSRIEVFNPVTGEILLAHDFGNKCVETMQSAENSIQWRVPSDMNMAGVRVFASSGTHTDGEQAIMPVYPSSQPVTDSETAYLPAGANTVELPMKHIKESNVILTYTANPIWDVFLSLPDIVMPVSDDALSLAGALYGNAVGAGLASHDERLRKALEYFGSDEAQKDSALVSGLRRYAALQQVALNNTPWVNDAQSESLRMPTLVRFADGVRAQEIVNRSYEALLKLGNADGGWSWAPGMKSSRWITSRVLSHLGSLNMLGYLPDKINKRAIEAVKYCDNDIVTDCRRYKKSAYPYASLLGYLYVRSQFDAKAQGEFANIKKQALTAIAKGWKQYDIYDKARAAILLHREGDDLTAGLILESLRQYASESETKGMWYDNLKSQRGPYSKLLITSMVLQAYKEIMPESANVDKLRQWLVMSKQTENWGASGATAEVTASILSSGIDWIDSPLPDIYIDGKKVSPDNFSRLVGNVTIPVSNEARSVRIIKHGGGPAWGGVMTQYVSPIADIRATDKGELRISKQFYAISADSLGRVAESRQFSPGDRVRVSLAIRAEKDMEYVSVCDLRPSCFEPADQLSSYTCSDGIWMYREIRNSGTNLFIPYLPKGTHVFTYDCYVSRDGEYASGMASCQCLYYPAITAHTGGETIVVGR